MKEFRLTSEVWQKAYLPYFAIFDPDGWDRRPDHFKRSWYEEKITRKEFLLAGLLEDLLKYHFSATDCRRWKA